MTEEQYDLDKIRKAYNRVQAALTQAKADGDAELTERYKADYFALKDLLAKAKEEQSKTAVSELKAAQATIAQLKEQVTAAKKTIGDLKFEVARLKDENHSLRTPPAPLNTSTSFNMTPYNTADWNFTHADLEAEFDRVLGPRGT